MTTMPPFAFYAVALMVILGASGVTFLKNTVLAAASFGATLLGIALLFLLMEAGWLAFAQVGLFMLPAAGLFHLAYYRAPHAAQGGPVEGRAYWAGLVSVLMLVVVYRVIASSDWGTSDHSKLLVVSGPLSLASYAWPLVLGMVLLAIGGWAFLRQQRSDS